MLTPDNSNTIKDTEKPDIVGEVDTVYEEIEYLEKKKKIPVVIWLILIIAVSILTIMITSNQSPTLQF